MSALNKCFEHENEKVRWTHEKNDFAEVSKI